MESNQESNFLNNVKVKNFSRYLTVHFKVSNKTVNDDVLFKLSDVEYAPIVRFDLMGKSNVGKWHTFIIVDPDAPVGFHIHECIYNIPEGDFDKGKIFYAYSHPNPPEGSGPYSDGVHRYYCIIYEQKAKIDEDLGIGRERGFSTYKDFTKLLKTILYPKASKFFKCKYGY